MPASSQSRLGIALMVLTTFVFGSQDALSRHLVAEANAGTVIWIRYGFFAVFVIALAMRSEGGLRAVARTHHPWLQVARGLALIVQLGIIIQSFVLLGLIETHALFAIYPLLTVALSALVLGERVTIAAWAAVATGAVGMLVLLRPGTGVLNPFALLVLGGAVIFAGYSLMTRYVSAKDRPLTSFFYTGVVGAIAMTLVGPFVWTPLPVKEWGWMAMLCVTGVLGHWLLIRAYELSPANRLQPFAYLQLVFACGYGIVLFGERLVLSTVLGAALIIGAGIFAVAHARR